MNKAKPDAFYSLREAVKYTPLSRETLARYLKRYQGSDWAAGKLWVKKREDGKGKTSTRYIISGKWVIEFNKKYKNGELTEHGIFTADELRYTLSDIVNYCLENNIKTVAEFVKNKENEEKQNIPTT